VCVLLTGVLVDLGGADEGDPRGGRVGELEGRAPVVAANAVVARGHQHGETARAQLHPLVGHPHDFVDGVIATILTIRAVVMK
jgi:hypothetical protein